MRTPAGLQAQGKALWKKITGEFDLDTEPDKLELLFQACKTADQIAELDDPPARFVAGQDAVATAEQVSATLLGDVDAFRDLSSSLAHDPSSST